MNAKHIGIAACALLLCGHSDAKAEFPSLTGPYFGQPLPDNKPVVFAPGIVSVDGRYEFGVTFSPDMTEMYFSPTVDGHSVVYVSERVNNQWTKPVEADFTNGHIKDEFGATISPDGKRLYFATYSDAYPLKVWFATRQHNGWSKPSLLDSPVNDERAVKPHEAENGDLYYLNLTRQKMFYAPRIDGNYPHVHEVDIEFGSHGTVSPEQDFLLLTAHKNNDKAKDTDIHVSFRHDDGSWSVPINLGSQINTDVREDGASLSPDGKFMFFSRYDEKSGNPNIYWVSTEVIHDLKRKYINKT